jgi:hypothetical protein
MGPTGTEKKMVQVYLKKKMPPRPEGTKLHKVLIVIKFLCEFFVSKGLCGKKQYWHYGIV